MAYESRLYIVKMHDDMDYAEIIARYDCGEMGHGNGWREIFHKSFNSLMYAEDMNTRIEFDDYGERLKYSEFPAVIDWIEEAVTKGEYCKLKPLLALLREFRLSEWADGKMKIVLYGY